MIIFSVSRATVDFGSWESGNRVVLLALLLTWRTYLYASSPRVGNEWLMNLMFVSVKVKFPDFNFRPHSYRDQEVTGNG